MTAPTLSWTFEVVGIDRERADVAPVERQRAAPGGEQAAGIADVEVDLVGRPVFGGLGIDVERLPNASLLTSGCMSSVSKNAPWLVPCDCRKPPATEMIIQ